MTATITVANLRTLLAASAPFADRYDDGHPALRCVQIQAGGGVITASATDRYTVGHVRRPATGDLEPAYLRRDDAEYIVGWLGARTKFALDDTEDLAEVAVTDGLFRIAVGDHVATPKARKVESFPDLGPLLDGVTGSSADGPLGLSLYVLDTLTAALTAAVGKERPARWTVGGPASPIRVEVDDWFVALVMPCSARGWESWADMPRVPYGLPVAVA